MSIASTNYRPEIDGLRTIAVMSVIFYHAGFGAFSGGYVGVDIFFVISGYLITAIIAREMHQDSFSFLAFYERRARRILPALFFVCALSSVAAWAILSPGQLRGFGQSLIATMGFAANIYFFLKSGYFSADIHTLPLIHMWSLAVEEQFYVLFPIVLLGLIRFARPWLWTCLLVAFILSLAASIYVQTSWPIGNFYLAPFRAWELLTGSLLALKGPEIAALLRARRKLGLAVEVAGVALIAAPILFYTDKILFPGVAAVPPVLGTAILILADEPTSPVRRLLALRPMVFVGLISYSAYLWHQPLFAFSLLALGEAPGTAGKLLLIAFTLIAAWLSWRFVERPFRNKRHFTRRAIFMCSLGGSMVFLGIGAILHSHLGFPDRFRGHALKLAATMAPQPQRTRCHTEGVDYRRPDQACVYFGGDPRWAVLGDSHGVELSLALAEKVHERQGASLVQLTFSGCQPAYRLDSSTPGCSRWTREATDWVAAQSGITDVLLTYRHNFHLFGDQTQTYPPLPDQHPNFAWDRDAGAARRAYFVSLEAQVRALLAAGKRVHIVAPVPELPVHVERLIFAFRPDMSNEGTSRKWHEARSKSIRQELARMAAMPGVTIVDPATSLCNSEVCRWHEGDTTLYFDDNHLSLEGARKVIRDTMLPSLVPAKSSHER